VPLDIPNRDSDRQLRHQVREWLGANDDGTRTKDDFGARWAPMAKRRWVALR
jgi:hypothetical protein